MRLDDAPIVEIACDESGSEGEKLIGGNTEVFAHASVSIELAAAEACVRELRRRIKSPAVEYKANHLLRAKHRQTLIWFLETSGPVFGTARVYLVEKAYALVRQVAARVADTRSAELALLLYREGPELVGAADWRAFLEMSNELLWVRNGDAPLDPEPYVLLLDRMRRAAAGRPVGAMLDRIWSARGSMSQRPTQTAGTPWLDPLIPALARAIDAWTNDGTRIAMIHDEQSIITDGLVARLKASAPALADVRLVDSMADARVQVADFLAGIARRIAEDELAGGGDPELVTLLRPYVDPLSVWGDAHSLARLHLREDIS
jgi:hypothetical protein